MNLESALLAEVIASPADDVPRLVYADWLDDHGGESERARAELIRVQIDLSCLSECAPERLGLVERERTLLGDWEDKWTAPLRPYFRKMEFRRGFVERVTVHADQVLRHGEWLFDLAPLRHVTLLEAASRMKALRHDPALQRLETLCLCANSFDLTLLQLLRSPHLQRLRGLELGRLSYHYADGRYFARSLVGALEGLPELESLTLNRWLPTFDLFERFADARFLDRIVHLALLETWAGFLRLAFLHRTSGASRLRTLDLSGNTMLSTTELAGLLGSTHYPALGRVRLRNVRYWVGEPYELRTDFGDRVQF
jgi:uncharacterized protein (TIGR02996 family)